MTTTTRRQFIKLSVAATAAMSIQNTFAEEKVKPLRILILGGTGFTGPFQVKYALSRGHKVTVFNRGKTHPGELPKEVEKRRALHFYFDHFGLCRHQYGAG